MSLFVLFSSAPSLFKLLFRSVQCKSSKNEQKTIFRLDKEAQSPARVSPRRRQIADFPAVTVRYRRGSAVGVESAAGRRRGYGDIQRRTHLVLASSPLQTPWVAAAAVMVASLSAEENVWAWAAGTVAAEGVEDSTFPTAAALDAASSLRLAAVLDQCPLRARQSGSTAGRGPARCPKSWCVGACGVPVVVLRTRRQTGIQASESGPVGRWHALAP